MGEIVICRPSIGPDSLRGALRATFEGNHREPSGESRYRILGASIAGFSSSSADATDSYRLSLELPGVKEDDIEITLHDHILSITGEKREERQEKTKSYFFSERSYGRFECSFQMPSDVVADKIQAHFPDGALKVTLPLSAAKESAVKMVKITS